MNSDLRRFKRALRRNLHCSLRTKRRLLEEFEHSLGLFPEDTPSPAFSQLETAFGSPSTMAAVLTESVSEKERGTYQLRQKIKKALAAVSVFLLFLFAIYSYYTKEYTIIETYSSVVEIKYINATEPTEE